MAKRTTGRLVANVIWLCIIIVTLFSIYIIHISGFEHKSGTEFRYNPITDTYSEEIIRREPTDNN